MICRKLPEVALNGVWAQAKMVEEIKTSEHIVDLVILSGASPGTLIILLIILFSIRA